LNQSSSNNHSAFGASYPETFYTFIQLTQCRPEENFDGLRSLSRCELHEGMLQNGRNTAKSSFENSSGRA
jgi:hypothetical protein